MVTSSHLRLCAVFAQNTDVISPLVMALLDVSLLLSLLKIQRIILKQTAVKKTKFLAEKTWC